MKSSFFFRLLRAGQDHHMDDGLARLSDFLTFADKTNVKRLCYTRRMQNDPTGDRTRSSGYWSQLGDPASQERSIRA